MINKNKMWADTWPIIHNKAVIPSAGLINHRARVGPVTGDRLGRQPTVYKRDPSHVCTVCPPGWRGSQVSEAERGLHPSSAGPSPGASPPVGWGGFNVPRLM